MCGVVIGTAPGFARAQDPNTPGDVLTRGPVHEAYAATAELPTTPPVVPKAPPEPIEELPPDQKPEGDNVQWLPGYWSWDEERADFIWISGFWRVSPPGQMWVPGSWRQVNGGYQWAAGFWQDTQPVAAGQPQAAAPEIEYLPPPPATIEAGPAVPAPDPTSVYVPGSWVYRGRYLWRPGVWVAFRPGWIWVPAHFRWTPVGYVFVEGYWDYPLARRGVIFAPMYFPPAVVVRPGFVYTPTYVISEPAMVGALFVRRGWGVYYFGDYFGPTYVSSGYVAWCAPALRGTITIGVGRGYFYDPLWSYYSVTYRSAPAWHTNVTNVYVGRFRGDIPPPPRTLVQQNTVINRITNVNVTNVTNNVTVVNNNIANTNITNRNVVVNNKDVTNVAMVAPVKVAAQLQPEARVQKVSADVQRAEAQHAQQIRQVAVRRQQAEAQVAKQAPNLLAQPPKADPRSPAAPAAHPQPVKVKLDVPPAVVARAQVKDTHQPPPPPHPLPKADPRTTTTTPTAPKVEPKAVQPPVTPPVTPKGVQPPPPPKVEPKTPPVTPPKVEPKVPPPVTPKVEPKLPPPPAPKVDPKSLPAPLPPPVAPPPAPKVEPKTVPTPPPPVPPKVEPPRPAPPVTVPPPTPKVEPKTPPPPPKKDERKKDERPHSKQ
jgi:hypothetical protein